jgi:hypothetical protein
MNREKRKFFFFLVVGIELKLELKFGKRKGIYIIQILIIELHSFIKCFEALYLNEMLKY